jgi:hypothetical protein
MAFARDTLRSRDPHLSQRDRVEGRRGPLTNIRVGRYESLLGDLAKLGYGDKGAGPIPPGAVLVFKLDLIGVLPDSSSVGQG